MTAMPQRRGIPRYVGPFLACAALALSFWWALQIAGTDVVIHGGNYGSSLQVALVGVDECGCEPSSEPNPDRALAGPLAKDQLRPLVAPAGVALFAMGFLGAQARSDLRSRRTNELA
jgi:hypothetical protein